MSRSYDRSPPLPPGGGPGPGEAYDAPYDVAYDGYGEPSSRASAPPQYARDARTAPPARGRGPAAATTFDYGGPLTPQDLTQPPRPRPRPPATQEPTFPASAPTPPREMYAPARTQRAEAEQTHAPIVPAGSVTGRSLTLVISIMCFLACLTAGAVYMMNQSASAWLRDIASEVTVQVEPRDKVDTEKTLREVVQFLGKQPGIRGARPLPQEESGALLEPWLGSSEALKSLPVPRLVSIELDRGSPPDFEALKGNLAKQFKGVTLDDHRQWQQQIRTVTRSFALGGIAILLLVAAATTAIIISATRAAMASNREIVEVLHFVGATDRFIAREFERNFMRLGIRAGLVGALAAMVVFAIMPTVMELLGGGSITMAEMHRLVGTGSLDLVGYGVLAALVGVVAGLCRFTSRFSVNRILHTRN
jgi:cell division transport system permease protein